MDRLLAAAAGDPLLPSVDLTRRSHGVANYAQHLVWLWRELPVPVIAAVHGVAFGGGFQFALGADLRYLASGTRLGVVEAKWGLVPDMGGTQLMRHLAREDVVRELTYTGRVFSAEQALVYGFATAIVDDPLGDRTFSGARDCDPQPGCGARRQAIAQSRSGPRRRKGARRGNRRAGLRCSERPTRSKP